MRGYRAVAILLLIAFATHGCAALTARQHADRLLQHLRENDEAWAAARQRLVHMCATTSAPSCRPRVVKMTNALRADDWIYDVLPPYQVIHAVHEEEIRRRHQPLMFEEFMIGVSRYLTERADRGEITETQLIRAFSAAWVELAKRTQNEVALAVSAVEAAERADAEAWRTFRETALVIGVVLAGALLGAAAVAATSGAFAPQPSPITTQVSCFVASAGHNTVTGQSYGLTVRCR